MPRMPRRSLPSTTSRCRRCPIAARPWAGSAARLPQREEQSPDRVQTVLWRRGGGVRARATTGERPLKQHRGGAHSIEGRGALATYDVNEDRLTLWSSTQLAHEVRALPDDLLRLDENQLRVVAPDVGGGFGAKFVMYPEEVDGRRLRALMLRRPIKWIEDRREHFLAAIQEREQYWDLEVAFEDDGRLLAVRGRMIHDQGAYTPQGINLPYNASTALPGPYILPDYELRRAGGRDQQGRDHAGARRRLSGRRVRDGARARRIADELGSTAPKCGGAISCRPEKMPYVIPLKTRAGVAGHAR